MCPEGRGRGRGGREGRREVKKEGERGRRKKRVEEGTGGGRGNGRGEEGRGGERGNGKGGRRKRKGSVVLGMEGERGMGNAVGMDIFLYKSDIINVLSYPLCPQPAWDLEG